MATVIKVGEQDPKLLKRLETLDVTDHITEAHAIVEAARKQAAEMSRTATRDAERLRKEAGERGYQEGFGRGYEVGKRTGHEQALEEASKRFGTEQADLVATLNAMHEQFEALKRDLFIEARDDVLRFAMHVAEKVTHVVGAVHPEAAVNNLEAALRSVEARTDLVAKVNSQDRETAERFAADFVTRIGAGSHLKIATDDSISPGGCMLQTPKSHVDATLDTQLDQIAALLVDRSQQS